MAEIIWENIRKQDAMNSSCHNKKNPKHAFKKFYECIRNKKYIYLSKHEYEQSDIGCNHLSENIGNYINLMRNINMIVSVRLLK